MKKVLVIDDDLDMTTAISHIVKTINPDFQCTCVNDPYEALLELADENFDLVLIDQRIPGLYGSELLKKIDDFINLDPAIEKLGLYDKPLQVIMMSGSADIKKLHLSFSHFNVTDYVQKSELTDFLRKKLSPGDQSELNATVSI